MGGEGTAARRARVVRRVADHGAAGLLVTHPPNVRYLSGFSGSSGWLLLEPAGARLLTDRRYAEQAPVEAADCEVIIGDNGLVATLASLERDAGALGYESHAVTCAVQHELAEARTDVEWKPTRGIVEGERTCKDAAELGAIRRALAIAEAALCEARATLRPGMTEVELAASIDYACRRRGAERMAFDTIVAAGASAALPHARPGDRRIERGEVVLVDLGCVVEGYCSDITRMLVLGDALPAAWQAWHDAVAVAKDAAIASISAGVPASRVDGAARSSLESAGLAERFVHGLGHGVGLQVHEAPHVSWRSDEELPEGAVITVEPGVYIPGEGGVRLEDLVVVTGDGCERLNGLATGPLSCSG